MPERARRSVILLLLLLAAAGGAWAIRASQPPASSKPGNPASYTFVTDIDTWRCTRRERLVSTPYDWRVTADLAALPMAIDGWRGQEDTPTDPQVLGALHPEAYLVRAYQRADGRSLWLSVVASRQRSSFHLPQVCYQGWSTVLQSVAVPLRRGELYAFSMVARQGEKAHLVYYFYLWPGQERQMEEGMAMFKVTAELQGTEQATRELIHAFIGLWFEAAVEDPYGGSPLKARGHVTCRLNLGICYKVRGERW